MRFAWQIAWMELKGRPVLLVCNIAIAVLIGWVFAVNVANVVIHGKPIYSDKIWIEPLDFLLLTMLPLLGSMMFSREYMSWSFLHGEQFMKTLRFYRMWAIPLRTIMWGRMLYMAGCLAVTLTGFVLAFVLTGWSKLSLLWTGEQQFAYVTIWLSYTIALSGMSPFLEFGVRSRSFMAIWGAFVVLTGAAAVLLFQWLGEPLYRWLFSAASMAWWQALLVLLLSAVVGMTLFGRLLYGQIRRIDLP